MSKDALTCDRCGVAVPAEWAFHEEAGETECPRCWHRCEEKELRDEIGRLRESAKLAEAVAEALDQCLIGLLDYSKWGCVILALDAWRSHRAKSLD